MTLPAYAWYASRSEDAKDVEEVVRAAIAGEQPLESSATAPSARSAIRWRPMRVLDVSELNAVAAYEPNELIITVQAGAPLCRSCSR